MDPFKELQAAQLRTAKLDLPAKELLSVCGLGLSGETGEVVDLIKKVFYHGKPFDRQKLLEKVGDVTWYVSLLCHVLDYDLGFLLATTGIPGYGHNLRNLTEKERYTRIGNRLSSSAGDVAGCIDYEVFVTANSVIISNELRHFLFWLETLLYELDTSMQSVMRLNIAKLEKRYPNGWNTADSIARKDENPNA